MSNEIEEMVRAKYGSVAGGGLSSDQAGVRAVAEAFGYSADELGSIPAEANMGLSCGNPTATAGLRPGEVVVDLGSGGGLDVFLAAKKVGPTGRAIGVDMTTAMVDLARRNAAKAGASNVEFHLAPIDEMPLADASVDCVISNCVLNLVTDKAAAFREIARILKPGGRLAISDIALKRPLPPEIASDLMAYVGCIAGAIPIEDYKAGLVEAGFSQVEIVDSGSDLNAYAKIDNQTGCCTSRPAPEVLAVGEHREPAPRAEGESCCGPAPAANTPELLQQLAELIRRHNVNDFAASVRVFAVKPA